MSIYYKAHLGGLFLYLYYKIYSMNKFAIILLGFGLVISANIYGQTSDQEKSSWWDTTKKFLDDSQKNITDRVGNLNKTLDEEIEELLNNDATELDTIKKIDGIRAYVEKYASLKEKDILNECRNGFSKGNCRIQIDKVLEDIERIVFDGEIIGYSKKIRQLQARISKLEDEKVSLNEKKYSVIEASSYQLEKIIILNLKRIKVLKLI